MSLVKQYRERAGLTMTAVAQSSQITLDKLSRIESGQRQLRVDEVARLARALGCQPSDLIPALPEESTPVATEEG